MRVLMLILMSHGYPYDQFRNIWRRYMKSHPDIDCYFYCGNPTLTTEYRLDEDTLWIRVPDTLDYVFEKTIRAFRYFVATRPNTYRFLFRPNASCVVNLNAYYELCKTFPQEKFCSAVVVSYPQGNVSHFPSGSGFTLSFDIVNQFAKESGLKPIYLDDVSIGYYLQEWKIPITPAVRYSFEKRAYSSKETTDILSRNFHFRFRSEDRNWDIHAMKLIVDTIYGKK